MMQIPHNHWEEMSSFHLGPARMALLMKQDDDGVICIRIVKMDGMDRVERTYLRTEVVS